MKNKFTLLELNQRNEIRADINLAFKKRLPLKCNRKHDKLNRLIKTHQKTCHGGYPASRISFAALLFSEIYFMIVRLSLLQILPYNPCNDPHSHAPFLVNLRHGKAHIVLFTGCPVIVAGMGHRINTVG